MDEVGATLTELWLSYNQIEKLDGLSRCGVLHTLFISNNRIKVWDELAKLANLPELKNVLLTGNPIYGDMEHEEIAPLVIKRAPQIEIVDGKMVSALIRKVADDL